MTSIFKENVNLFTTIIKKSTQLKNLSTSVTFIDLFYTVKLGYNKKLWASKFVPYNQECIITGVVYVLYLDLVLKYLLVITGGWL